MVNIVNVQVSQQVASAPSTLQRTGALLTQGGTNTAANTATLLTAAADFVAIKSSTNTSAAAELQSMVDTFFAQGNATAVYVLELGSDGTPTPAEGVIALTTYITTYAGTTSSTGLVRPRFYSYLVPKSWDTESTFKSLVANYSAPASELYFYISTTLTTYSAWSSVGYKAAFCVVPSTSAPTSEFSAAAFFYVSLAYDPNASNLVSPMSYTYLYGVTPNKALTNAQQTSLLAGGMNWIGTGAEGGISLSVIYGGQFLDLHPFNYWYAVDWLAINSQLYLAGAVINGSNNPQNPLYYNQNGINRLQSVAQSVVNNGISFGLILAPATVNAVSFTTYVAQNPSDYSTGTYKGLSLTFVPARGFQSITIYLTASNIPV